MHVFGNTTAHTHNVLGGGGCGGGDGGMYMCWGWITDAHIGPTPILELVHMELCVNAVSSTQHFSVRHEKMVPKPTFFGTGHSCNVNINSNDSSIENMNAYYVTYLLL